MSRTTMPSTVPSRPTMPAAPFVGTRSAFQPAVSAAALRPAATEPLPALAVCAMGDFWHAPLAEHPEN